MSKHCPSPADDPTPDDRLAAALTRAGERADVPEPLRGWLLALARGDDGTPASGDDENPAETAAEGK